MTYAIYNMLFISASLLRVFNSFRLALNDPTVEPLYTVGLRARIEVKLE